MRRELRKPLQVKPINFMLNPGSTLVIILGVSQCPRAPKLQPLPQCANSAIDFEHYIRSSLAIPRENILTLFNSPAAASDQLDQIEDWLAQSTTASFDGSPSDLIIYYTGHGGFSRNDQSYFLAIYKTRDGSEGGTSIRYVDLASAVKRHATNLRKYLILDCCFAAAAIVKTQTDIGRLVLQRVEDELPSTGTAVLCSSAAKLVSIAPLGERYTMFSGALLQCLRDGVPQGPRTFTLEDVGNTVRNIIQNKYPNNSVRPEVHVPEQARGDPAKVPLFPNVLWTENSADVAASGIATIPARVPEGQLTKVLRRRSVKFTLGTISGLCSTFACALIPPPIGLAGLIGPGVAPIAPALFLAVGVIFVLNSTLRLTLGPAILIPFVTYGAWFIAWWIALLSVLYSVNYIGQICSFFGSFGVAGYVGSFLLNLTLATIQLGRRAICRQTLRSVSLTSVAFGLWGAIVGCAASIFNMVPQTFTFMFVLFLPWHGWYFLTLTLSDDRDHDPPTRFQYILWLTSSMALIALLAPSAISGPLNEFLDRYTPPERTLALKVNTATATSKPTGSNSTVITVNYSVHNNSTFNSLSCDGELHNDNIIYQSDNNDKGIQLNGLSANITSRFTISTQVGNSLEIRLICHALYSPEDYSSGWISFTLDNPGPDRPG